MRRHTDAVRISLFAWGLFGLVLLGAAEAAGVLLTIHSRTAVDFELVGYDGLNEISLAKENIVP